MNGSLAITLSMNLQSDSTQNVYLDIISKSSSRINDLINGHLISSIESETLPEKYSIYRLIEDALVTINDRIVLKRITIRQVYRTQDFSLIVNKQKLNIALCNIMTCAINSIAKDTGVLTLVTKSIKGKSVIEIQDNGTGFKKKSLRDRLKSYFTDQVEGLSLDLSATLSILRSSHIKVDLQSELGKGTRFIISFSGKEYSGKLI
jgi:two-component system, sporulation sensor kinase E